MQTGERMTPEAMEALVARTETATTADRDFVRDFLAALDAAFPELDPVDVAALASAEVAVAAIDRALPGWRIQLERAGRWRCTLRESAARDDDELIGIASGPSPALAMLAALLAVAARRARGYL
jgi:hypothetical protein